MGSVQDTTTLVPSFSPLRSVAEPKIMVDLHSAKLMTVLLRKLSEAQLKKMARSLTVFWYSGLCQTTYLGIPDTEMISPFAERASLLALNGDLKRKIQWPLPVCCIRRRQRGQYVADIPALVALLHPCRRRTMIIIEDWSCLSTGAEGQLSRGRLGFSGAS